jgi:hypothetical protein
MEMKNSGKFRVAANLGAAGMALLTALAMLIAPICAPLCGAASCEQPGQPASARLHCQQMAMNDAGSRIERGHPAPCGSGDVVATANEPENNKGGGQAKEIQIAAAWILGEGESAAVNGSGTEFGSRNETSCLRLKSSSIVVLKT